MSQEPGLFDDAEIIHSYSRAQAIEDGVLVDLRQGELEELVAQAGFKYPVACTSTVFASCIDLTPAAKRACNDIKGRLWDILWMLKCAIRTSRSTDRITFTVRVVRDRVRPTPTELVAVCGPGDTPEPVITIMFPGED
jgi:uncharacterized protein DUF6573